jgi:hypothetical protein
MALLDLQSMEPPQEEVNAPGAASHGSHGCDSGLSLLCL